ncbi:MAG TPA: RnfABCDGE type electron transport complex subunit C [bacterium]|nr:RnfABCDGE type electron transport complex subunit C [bacterium]
MTGAIRLQGKKETSLICWTIHRSFPPSKVYIPLNQHKGLPSIPCVGEGDRVLTGQKIAEPQGPSSVALHAGISGRVAAIGSYPHPVLGLTEAIEIHGDGVDEKWPGIEQERAGWQHLSAREIYDIFQDSGLVDAGKEVWPLHIKAAKPQGVKIDAVLFNGAEPEPYVTSDYSLMMSHALEILKGADIIRGLLGAARLVVTLDPSQREAAELLKSKIYFLKWAHAEVKILSAGYPQDAEVSLVHDVFGTDRARLLSGKETGIRVFNIASAFSAYEAVVFKKPFYERAVTVGGECVVEPKNVWMRIGTSFEDAFRSCRGLLREPSRVLMNGPMRGIAQEDLSPPVIKGTQAILALPKEVTDFSEVEACIRCNRCVDACPAEISPVMITLASERDLFDTAQKWGASYCIECGNCAYVCPAKRPMMELIAHARFHLRPSRTSYPAKKAFPSFSEVALKETQEIKDLAETKITMPR